MTTSIAKITPAIGVLKEAEIAAAVPQATSVLMLLLGFDEIAKDKEQVKQLLRARVKALGGRPARMKRPTPPPAPPSRTSPTQIARRVTPAPAVSKVTRKRPSRSSYNLVAIGTSTGGPVALQRVLTVLPANFPLPLLLIQHMPASFTPAFAQRLNALCQIEVREAKDGDMLKPGLALLAPGGKQMILERGSGAAATCRRPQRAPFTRMVPPHSRCTATSGGANAPSAF